MPLKSVRKVRAKMLPTQKDADFDAVIKILDQMKADQNVHKVTLFNEIIHQAIDIVCLFNNLQKFMDERGVKSKDSRRIIRRAKKDLLDTILQVQDEIAGRDAP